MKEGLPEWVDAPGNSPLWALACGGAYRAAPAQGGPRGPCWEGSGVTRLASILSPGGHQLAPVSPLATVCLAD